MKTLNPRLHFNSLLAAAVVVTALALPSVEIATAQTSIGVYSDASGSSCTLADQSVGFVNAYVVVRPGAGGSSGIQFAAPMPACFTGSYVADLQAPNTLVIGNSQTGVTIALLGCETQPVHALTIQYMGSGTTPTCCPYPVIADPAAAGVISVDCLFNEEPAIGVVSYINPDGTCLCQGNSPPNQPDQPSPVSGAINVSVFTSLGWVATDIDNNLAEFDVYLGTSPTPPLVATVTQQSHTPGQLAPFTLYYWRVVARDAGGLQRSSDTWTFTTRAVNSPPLAPSNPSPFNGALAVPVNASLFWQGGDIDGDTLVYDVYFGTSPTPPLVASNVGVTSYTPPTLAFGTDYYWRVVARDPLGLETSGPVWTFEARLENYPPNPPFNPAPPNNALNVPINVTLSWQATDPDGDTLTFDLYFGTAIAPPLLAAGLTTNSYQLPQLIEGQQYFWMVVAKDQTTQTSGSIWSFRTVGANLPPIAPYSPNPPAGVDNVLVTTSLSWQSGDPNGDPLTYDIYFGDSPGPPLLLSNYPINSFSPGVLAFSTHYFWRVVARDIYGATTSGPGWSFVTRANTPPSAPSNPIPAHNGISSLNPTLRWSSFDLDAQPLTFDVYFGTDPSPPLAASGLTSAMFGPGMLQDETTYHWRVVASDGTYSTSGPTWTFAARTGGGSGPSAVEIWADPYGSDCSLSDVAPGIVSAYVIVYPFNNGVAGLQFAAPKPGCFTGSFIGDALPSPFISIGNSQTGISIAFTGCLTEPVHALTVQYFGFGTTPPCCEYPVIPDPNTGGVITVDCDFVEHYSPSRSAWINEDPSCYCGTLVPVAFSGFKARVMDAGVEVSWELAGDETAERYTLMRRAGEEGALAVIGEGAVSGTKGSHLDTTVEPATTYHYEMLVRTAEGNEFRSPVATVTTRALALELGQNHPNPFNPTTVIPYTLPNGSTPARVRLLILDVSGRVVRTLVDEDQAGGPHEVVWDGRDDRGGPVSSGVYFSVLDADGDRRTRKLVLLK